MTKKRKHDKHAVKPDYAIGDAVLFRGERHIIEAIRGLHTGNRPMYRMVGVQGIYPETFLKRVEE